MCCISMVTNDLSNRLKRQGVACVWDCDGFNRTTKQIKDPLGFGLAYLQLTWIKYQVHEITWAERAIGVLLTSTWIMNNMTC